MIYLSDFFEDSTLDFFFTTHDGADELVAPSSAFDETDFVIYKDNSATQRATMDGVTVTSPFDSIVGLHQVHIDTSVETGDAGFWATGSDYTVVLSTAKTVDGMVPGEIVAQFSIENRYHEETAVPGAYSCTVTVCTTGGAPIDGVVVWPSQSATGTTAYANGKTTSGGGQATFWLGDNDTYYFFFAANGYSFANDGSSTLVVSGAGVNDTFNVGTAVSGSVAAANTSAFLTVMVNRIRQLTDEPSTNKKYSDVQLYDYIQEAYAGILGEVQRNSNTQIVSEFSITYDADEEYYYLPPTCGTVIAIGYKDTNYGTKIFYERGSHLSEYGTRVTLQDNYIHIQKGWLAVSDTITVWYLATGCAKLFNGTSADTITASSIQLNTINIGTQDVRPYAYVGSKLRIVPDGTNAIEQERIITGQSGTTYDVYAVSPDFSPTPTHTAEFEIIPQFPSTFDAVVASKVAMTINGIEGDDKRWKISAKDYQDKLRTLLLQTSTKDFMQGSQLRNDGYQGSRGSRPHNRRPPRVF